MKLDKLYVLKVLVSIWEQILVANTLPLHTLDIRSWHALSGGGKYNKNPIMLTKTIVLLSMLIYSPDPSHIFLSKRVREQNFTSCTVVHLPHECNYHSPTSLEKCCLRAENLHNHCVFFFFTSTHATALFCFHAFNLLFFFPLGAGYHLYNLI